MGRGGARVGAGRPRGTKNRRAPRWRRPTLDPESRAALLVFCREICESGKASEILNDALNSSDPAERFRAVQFIASYGLGLPVSRVQVQAAVSFEDLLTEFARETATAPELTAADPAAVEAFAREVEIYKARETSTVPTPPAITPPQPATTPPATASSGDDVYRVPRRETLDDGTEVLPLTMIEDLYRH